MCSWNPPPGKATQGERAKKERKKNSHRQAKKAKRWHTNAQDTGRTQARKDVGRVEGSNCVDEMQGRDGRNSQKAQQQSRAKEKQPECSLHDDLPPATGFSEPTAATSGIFSTGGRVSQNKGRGQHQHESALAVHTYIIEIGSGRFNRAAQNIRPWGPGRYVHTCVVCIDMFTLLQSPARLPSQHGL